MRTNVAVHASPHEHPCAASPLARELHIALWRIHAAPEVIERLRRKVAFCRAMGLRLHEDTHGAEDDELRLWFEIARRDESGLYRVEDIAQALGLTVKQVCRAINELGPATKA